MDAEISVTIHGGTIKWKQALGTGDSEPFIWRPSSNHVGGFMRDHVPAFTASRDAAATLMPAPWGVIIDATTDEGVEVRAVKYHAGRVAEVSATVHGGDHMEARARTAAALRAMAEEAGMERIG